MEKKAEEDLEPLERVSLEESLSSMQNSTSKLSDTLDELFRDFGVSDNLKSRYPCL